MEELLNFKEALNYLKMSPNTLGKYIRSKDVKATKIGGKWLFKKSWLDEFINANCNI